MEDSFHTFNECHTPRCYFVLHHSCLYCPSLFPKTNKTCRNVYKFINVQQRGSRVWHHSSRDTCLWIKEYSENTYAQYHSEIIIMIQNKHQLFQNIWMIKEMEDLLQRIFPDRKAQNFGFHPKSITSVLSMLISVAESPMRSRNKRSLHKSVS